MQDRRRLLAPMWSGTSAIAYSRVIATRCVTLSVNLCGYLRTESGVGTAIRRYRRAMECVGIPIALHDLSGLTINRGEDRSVNIAEVDCTYDINLICVDLELHY